MTISRNAIAAYLNTQFRSLAVAIGQVSNDSSDVGYGSDVDEAFRELGKAEDELADATAEDSQRKVVFALASYYAARRIWRALGDRVDHTMNESRFDFRDQRKSAKEMMEDSANLCASLGYIVDGRVPHTPFSLFKVY